MCEQSPPPPSLRNRHSVYPVPCTEPGPPSRRAALPSEDGTAAAAPVYSHVTVDVVAGRCSETSWSGGWVEWYGPFSTLDECVYVCQAYFEAGRDAAERLAVKRDLLESLM